MEETEYYLISYDHKGLAYQNISTFNFKSEGFFSTPLDTLEKVNFTRLNYALEELTQRMKEKEIRLPDADMLIANNILENIPISLQEAGNAEFWNGLSIINDSIHEFIQTRWNHQKKWFRSNIVSSRGDYTRIRRYITRAGITEIPRGTLSRIWWASKLSGPGLMETIWKQQDLVDNLLERTISSIDNHGQLDQVTLIFLKILKALDEREAIPNRQNVVRQVLKWIVGLQNYLIIEPLSQSEIEEKVAELFHSALKLPS